MILVEEKKTLVALHLSETAEEGWLRSDFFLRRVVFNHTLLWYFFLCSVFAVASFTLLLFILIKASVGWAPVQGFSVAFITKVKLLAVVTWIVRSDQDI